MMEEVFLLFLITALGVVLFAFWQKAPHFLILGAMLFFASGLFLLDTSAASGIEETNGFVVRAVGDNNFNIDYNTTWRNAGNDTGLLIMGNVFLWGSVVLILVGMGQIIFTFAIDRKKKKIEGMR